MRAIAWHKRLHQVAKRQRAARHTYRSFHASGRSLLPRSRPDGSDITQEEEAVKKEAEAASADAEQKNGRTNGHRLRGTLRRPREVPAPPPTPEWFLKHNVRLYDTAAEGVQVTGGEKRVLRLVHEGTGETVLSIPYVKELTRDLSHSESGKEKPSGTAPFFFSQVAPQEASAKPASPETETTETKHPSEQVSEPNPSYWLRIHTLALIEAAFSLAGPETGRVFSATKTNLTVQFVDNNSHEELDHFVEEMASLARADVIRFDANDFAELGEDYVGDNDDTPGSISTLSYETYRGFSATAPNLLESGPKPEDEKDMDEMDPEDMESDSALGASPFGNMQDLKQILEQNKHVLDKALGGGSVIGIGLGSPLHLDTSQSMQSASRSASSGQPIGSWDELKLSTLLDELLDAASLKKDSGKNSSHDTFFRESFLQRSELEKRKEELPDLNALAVSLSNHVNNRIRALAGQPSDTKFEIRDEAPVETEDPANQSKTPRTIIHIRDIHNLRMTRQGDAVVNRLARLVQKRRRDGEQIMIIGTVASSRVLPMTSSEEDEESLFRTIISHPWPKYHTSVLSSVTALSSPPVSDRSLANPGYKRLLDINFRNIQSLIRRLKLPMDENAFTNNFRQHLNLPGTSRLGDHALPQVEIQRIVLHAEGLRTLFTQSPTLTLAHIALSAMILEVADTAMGPKAIPTPIVGLKPMERTGGTANGAAKRERSRPNMELIRKNASKHEQKMLSGVVDPQNIKTTFNQVHAPKETIEALKTLTTLSLLRPEAFSYGVLANDRLPGLLLYGPPGTGKTLLAKAVAKESQATVLEVSGAQVYEKYVGEGEKMVKAVFSLARKLSPCVVFIDEADALFGSRGNAGNRTTHREIINQFLREWDGMDDHGVFMMVATNRPFDLDDAVLRRLPRRLLVDLPVAKDRESILGIHLKGETLDPEVSLAKLAEQTPLYSGSDLKNLCVAAALTAVREENELLAEHKDDKEFKLPERRTLNVKHFEKAIAEISASINEDMSSLSAIRKFDEQFGDRRGRRKKSGYGFGGAAEVDESAARVRDQPRP